MEDAVAVAGISQTSERQHRQMIKCLQRQRDMISIIRNIVCLSRSLTSRHEIWSVRFRAPATFKKDDGDDHLLISVRSTPANPVPVLQVNL